METMIGIYAKININIINNPEKTMQKNKKNKRKNQKINRKNKKTTREKPIKKQ